MPKRFLIESVTPVLRWSLSLASEMKTSVFWYDGLTSKAGKRNPPQGTLSRLYCGHLPRLRVSWKDTRLPPADWIARTSQPPSARTSSGGLAEYWLSSTIIRRAPASFSAAHSAANKLGWIWYVR